MPFKDKIEKAAYHKKYMREKWYPKNRKTHGVLVRAAEKKRLATLQAAIQALKSSPCVDCGNRYPPVCMDFDHLPGRMKVGNVSRMVRDVPFESVIEEIAKCEIVCANCHRIRTAARQRK